MLKEKIENRMKEAYFRYMYLIKGIEYKINNSSNSNASDVKDFLYKRVDFKKSKKS